VSLVSVDKDLERLSLTLVAEFDAPLERVWQLWADPRQLEPPTHPATVEKHDMELRFAFASAEHMERLERWGAFDVFPQSVAQMDALLTEPRRP